MRNYTETFFVIWLLIAMGKIIGLIPISWFWVFSPFLLFIGISVLIGILISLVLCITGFMLLIRTFKINDRN